MNIYFSIDSQVYSTAIQVQSMCNAITFWNRSDGTAYINGVPYLPGEKLEISGNGGEIDTTIYKLSFDSAVTAPLVVVYRKTYIKK